MKIPWKVNRITKSGDTKWRGSLGRDLLKVRLTWRGRTINVFMGPRALRIGQVLIMEML
jgi:hypothetical protein